MWLVFDEIMSIPFVDIHFMQCRFGSPFYKPTRLRVFGDLDLRKLNKVCTKKLGVFTCGKAFHQGLGFGATPTALAAAYPSSLCHQWAQQVREPKF